jgi:hypothetical protein
MFLAMENIEMILYKERLQTYLITCLHWGASQPRVLKVVDVTELNTVEEHPTQPLQGIQAASLLVSKAMRNVWAGVPTFALTM